MLPSPRKVTPGRFHPLGAALTPEGVNFALYSERADGVDLLLFDRPDGAPAEVVTLTERDRYVWHALVHGLKAGQLYGYRVRGPWRPEKGLRFNPAKGCSGTASWTPAWTAPPTSASRAGKFRSTPAIATSRTREAWSFCRESGAA